MPGDSGPPHAAAQSKPFHLSPLRQEGRAFFRIAQTLTAREAVQDVHGSFLTWRHFLYAKIAAGVSALAIVLYAIDKPVGPPNGGSWLGYTLGTLGLGLIVWLTWFGVRRRRYGGTKLLEGILSAHVYLGLALLVVATLHTGFQLHWNVHSLAYVLMVLVIVSGMFGALAFWRMPGLLTANRAGATLGGMTKELATLDLKCRALALAFPDEVVALVHAATAMPGRQRASARHLGMRAIARVQHELGSERHTTPAEVLPLVTGLTERMVLVRRLNRDRLHRQLLLQWRTVHVPLTVGLVAALGVHVFAVFYRW